MTRATDIEEVHLGEAVKMKCKRPRGRPPMGAVLTDKGTYELPPEAIEAAAERMIRHRNACRERYVATRQGLREAKPELFRKKRQINQTLDGDECNPTPGAI